MREALEQEYIIISEQINGEQGAEMFTEHEAQQMV